MGKTLLIVCGGIEATHGIKLARAVGHHVVVSDMNPTAPGMRLADHAIIASTYDVAQTVAAARDFHENVRPIDGVMCIGSDVPLTVTSVANALGLPGISLQSAYLASDKLAMKDCFKAAGVPIPWYSAVNSADHLGKIVGEVGADLVLKPADSRGSRGVLRLTPETDLSWAYAASKAQSPTDRVMVEAYLPGPQVSTESIVINGECYTPGFSDRNYEYLDRYAPYFIENGGDLPSHLAQDVQDKVKQVVADAARAMGISRGNVKGDIVVVDGKPHVIELAARLSGGYFCTLEIPMNTGVDFVGNVIKLALDEPINRQDLEPKFQKPVVQRYKFPDPGKITAIWGVHEARALPGIHEVMVSAELGDIVPQPSDTTARAAMVIATGDTIEDARTCADLAVETIRVQTETEAPQTKQAAQ